MINLRDVSWKNLFSYGDYLTELQLADIGQCLITGEVIKKDSEPTHGNRSNSAGKSSIINVILWVLFGKTMHSPYLSGDNILNWFTTGDGFGRVRFLDGSEIVRIRTRRGTTELIYTRNGNSTTLSADTLATTKIQQKQLDREFGLDWDLLCGAAFFNQYNRPWMEMRDAERKQIMERMLHVDRYTYYAVAATDKCTACRAEQTNRQTALQKLSEERDRLLAEIELNRTEMEHFEENKQRRVREVEPLMVEQERLRNAIVVPDLAQLRGTWDLVTQIRGKATAYADQAKETRLRAQQEQIPLTTTNNRIAELQRRIESWRQKDGRVCVECELETPHAHAEGKILPLNNQIDTLTREAAQISLRVSALQQEAAQQEATSYAITQRVDTMVPTISVQDATRLQGEWQQRENMVQRYRDRITDILAEVSQHAPVIERAQRRLSEIEAETTRLDHEIALYDQFWKSYNYLASAYRDRRKVKSYAVARHLPYVNARLLHYLDVSGLDLQMQFTSSLGIQSSHWGYDYYCGGERKRTDIAIMMSAYDLHEQMYGRQCNIMTLDEVDGRLDGAGVEGLVQIIKNDLAGRVSSIFVISHKEYMLDIFPRQLHVKNVDKFSYIEEIR